MDLSSDLYYLRTIHGRLKELYEFAMQEMDDLDSIPSIGTEALNDEIDWLDCYIERLKKG